MISWGLHISEHLSHPSRGEITLDFPRRKLKISNSRKLTTNIKSFGFE